MSNWHRNKGNKGSLRHKQNKEKIRRKNWIREQQVREKKCLESMNKSNKTSILYFFSPFFPKELSQRKARNKFLFFLSLVIVTFAISLYIAMSYSITE